MSIALNSAMEEFRHARSKAFAAALLALIRRQPREMLSFEDVRACLNIRAQAALGVQSVPLASIIGSEGRYRDFDRHFLPRSDRSAERWSSIQRAMMQGIALPAVELYKIGDVYFVRDGNHRISVARWLGYGSIDAVVTELRVDVPIDPGLSLRTLLFTEEYSDFLEWTNLHLLRPEEHIVFSDLGSYLDLVRHINLHRHALTQAHGREIGRDEAVAGWYDTVYLPVARAIAEQQALKRMAGRTEADLYLWLIEQQLGGADPRAPGKPGSRAVRAGQGFDRVRCGEIVIAAARAAALQLGR